MKKFLEKIGAVIAGAIMACILFLFLLDVVFMPFIVDVPNVKIPILNGLPMAKASEKLSQLGLKTVVGDSSFDESIPLGAVISSRPNTGKRVKKGRAVTLSLSKGQRFYMVPEVRGVSLRDARLKLETKNLNLGEIRYISSEIIPQTVVLDQFPAPGSKLIRYGEVNLHVSSGSEQNLKSIPNLIYTSIKDVEDSLSKYEMTLGEISETIDDNQPMGIILLQNPSPGVMAARLTPIDLTINVISESQPGRDDESR